MHKPSGKKWLAAIAASLLLLLAGCDKTPNGSITTIQRPPEHFRLADISGSSPSLQFSMFDTDSNKDVTGDSYQGKYVLMYFGYTHCPDVCPTTLVKISRALKQIGERLAKNTQVLFVTLDPARDTPKLMDQYTKNFGPHITGLRGDDAQTKSITDRYHVAYGTGKKDENGMKTGTTKSCTVVRSIYLVRRAKPA